MDKKEETTDIRLVKRSVKFHGIELLRRLGEEQQQGPPTAALLGLVAKSDSASIPLEIKSDSYQKQVCTFIAKKSDLLFKSRTDEKECQRPQSNIDDAYAIMPPLETFMKIPVSVLRDHFYKSLKELDCVTGVVTQRLEKGLLIRLLCVDMHQSRDIEDLDIMAYCPQKELPRLYAKESALDAFQEKDIVRAIVHSIDASTERIILSMLPTSLPDPEKYPRIGLITDTEFPVHYRRISQIQDMTYEEMLHSVLGFNNTGNVKALVSELGINDSTSFLRYNARLKIPEKEYAEGLKKWQSQKLAHQSVAQGVDFFKQGKEIEAMQHFSRALQIDPNNVEALVARGALYANKESFQKAIQDFEDALVANPNHNNARNYLVETLLTFGKSCEDKRELDDACLHYQQALKIDKDHAEAQDLLNGCQRLIAFQKLQGENDGKINTSILAKTTEKLKELIQEDKKKIAVSKKKSWSRSSSQSDSSPDRGRPRKKKNRHNISADFSSGDEHYSQKKSGRQLSRARSSSCSDRSLHLKKSRQRSSSSSSDEQPGRKSNPARENPYRESTKIGAKRRRSKAYSPSDRNPSKKEHRKSYNDKERKGSEERGSSLSPSSRNFPIKMENIASSFLPISSQDYFSTSTAIPGFGSPEKAEVKDTLSKYRHSAQKIDRPILQDKYRAHHLQKTDSNSPNISQQKVIDLTKRSSSKSLSRSRSRSSDGDTKRLLKPRTGVSELDMYLGNIQGKNPSPDILSEWQEFMRQRNKSKTSPKRKGYGNRLKSRSVSKSPSHSYHRSRSPSQSSKSDQLRKGRRESPELIDEQISSKRTSKLQDKFTIDNYREIERLRKNNPEASKIIDQLRQNPSLWQNTCNTNLNLKNSDRGEQNRNSEFESDAQNLDRRSFEKSLIRNRITGGSNLPMKHTKREEEGSPPSCRKIMKLEKVPSKFGQNSKELLSMYDKNFSIISGVEENRNQIIDDYDGKNKKSEKMSKNSSSIVTVRKPAMDDPNFDQRLVSSNELGKRSERNNTSVQEDSDDYSDDPSPKKVGKKDKKKKKKKEEKKKKRKSSGGEDEEINQKKKKNKTKKEEKTFPSQDDLEKEIERRVRERLMAEEEKLRKTLSFEKSISHKKDVNSEQKNITKDTHPNLKKSSVTDGKEHIAEDNSKKDSQTIPDKEKSLDRPIYLEVNSGWVKDCENNMYYAVRGRELEAGEHVDRHGNKYVVKAMSKSEYIEAKCLLKKEGNSKRLSRYDERTDWLNSRDGYDRSKQTKDSKRYRGNREYWEKTNIPTHKQKRFNLPRSRSPSEPRSRSRRKSRSRSRRKSSSRSHSYSRSNSRSRSRSRSRQRHGLSKDKRITDGAGDLGSKDVNKSKKPMPSKENSSSKELSDLPVKKSTRWDTKTSPSESGKSVGVVEQSRWEDVEDENLDEKSIKKDEDKLTDLEKFLKNLKQTKKKQWIAEGKVKE